MKLGGPHFLFLRSASYMTIAQISWIRNPIYDCPLPYIRKSCILIVVERGRGLRPPFRDNRADRQKGNALDRRRREAGEVQPMRCEGFNLPSGIATLGHVRRSGFDSRASPILPRKSPRLVKIAGEIGAGDIARKVGIARTVIYQQPDLGGIRK